MRLPTTALAAALLAVSAAPAPVAVATYPSPTFLENLDVAADGAVTVTSYLDRRLLRGRAEGGFSTFATLPAHPVAVLGTADGFVLTAHGKPFTDGPAFLESNQLLFLDRAGAVVRTIAVPQARFLNGIVAHGAGFLVADSVAGLIWRLDPATGAVTPWLRHERLTSTAPALPGANGLKIRGDTLYVSNSSRGTIDRVALARDGTPAGPPTAFASPGQVDDFVFTADGGIVATSHGAVLHRLAADGRALAPVMASGCDGCTAVGRAGEDLIVLTSGDLLAGGKAPARVLRLPPAR